MNSPLARIILIVLGGYFVIMLFLIAYDWIKEEFPNPPAKPPKTERIQHTFYHKQAVDALQRFSQLPQPERNAIKNNLKSSLVPMEEWLSYLERSDYQIMCIGEFHEESTRNFLAEMFFAKFSVDVLLLEATPKEVKRLLKRMNAGRSYFPLLDAEVIKILRTVKARNLDIKICGIEETDKQHNEQRGQSGSRDKSIARNFWKRFQPGMRRIILFGAMHCTNESSWLFENLNSQAPLFLKERMLNAQVLEEHQNGALEAFIFFLDEIGMEKKNFVIPDTKALNPRIYEFFQMLNSQILAKVCTLIVFLIYPTEDGNRESYDKIYQIE